MWIPSRSNIPGNERAGSLAKESLCLSDPFLICKCYYSNLYSKFKKSAKEKVINTLLTESLYKGLRYFQKIETFLSPPWYSKINKRFTRPVITMISRLKTHHAAVNSHLWEKNIISSPVCSCGNPNQDLNHLFFHCPTLYNFSNILITFLLRTNPTITLDIPTIAFSNCTKAFKAIYFFEKCQHKDLALKKMTSI